MLCAQDICATSSNDIRINTRGVSGEKHRSPRSRINMFQQLSLLALLALATASPTHKFIPLNPLTPSGQIIGGTDAKIEEFPHQVSLQSSGFGFCGGSIISDVWVVTAAHCMTSYPASWITVRAGTATKSSGGSLHQVEQVIIHENHVTNRYGVPENDVAVLKVKTPFKLDKTRQPVKLFKKGEESVAGVSAVITGWGATREGGSTIDRLQTVNVPIVSKSSCDTAYKSYGGLPSGQICAAVPEGGKDACQGDSGGPMTIGGRLAGLVSWGYGCARRGYPGVHTEVAAYSDWISSKTGVKL
ncbi:mite allergen Der f 3 [Megachile rotundata]|uniref:mite allergen Der f 3 n=1 Tax=Megachile rotundata TaxID=143995 RepID=UPI003FD414B3